MIPETYVHFGEEWEKEIMKCSKPIMVQLYKKSCQRSLDAEKEIERLKGLIEILFKEGLPVGIQESYWQQFKTESNI